MPSASSLLLTQIRHALVQAGFHLDGDDAEDGWSGLAVTEAPTGVVVKWTTSDEFSALVREQPTAPGSMPAIVQAAVTGLLVQMGHTVTEPPDGAGLLVLADR